MTLKMFARWPGLVLGAFLLASGAWGAPPPAIAPSGPAAPPPGFQPPPTTLEKIRGYGAIYVGHHDAAIPFSYIDDQGGVHGYSWELCMRVVDAVKQRLGKPDLQVVPVLTTAGSRVMMVETGTLDLECGSTTNSEQRQRYVGFSNTVFVAGIKGLVRKEANIRSLADLKGKTVATAAGSTADAYVKAAATRRNVSVNYRSARGHDEGFNQVLGGAADVFVLDDILLVGLLADARKTDASRLTILDETFGLEPYGLMFRRNDPEFKKLVDETLLGLMRSGEFERIYAKWFQSPIPPRGINLNVPPSPELKQLIKTPNDRGV